VRERGRAVAAWACLVLVGLPGTARSGPGAAGGESGAANGGPGASDDDRTRDGTSFSACAPDTAARLGFIEDRLDAGRSYARYWWGGWTGFYGIGTVVTSVQAATEDDRGERANDVVSAAKAAFGTARLLYAPPAARKGAAALRALPVSGEDECRRRLARGEELLRASAAEAGARYSWTRHLANVGINVAGGLIVAEGFDEPGSAWTSAGIGIGVGEAMLWSHPWRARADLAEYERRFPADGVPRPAPVSWELVPCPGGAGIRLAF
jgi:hypothetical protein